MENLNVLIQIQNMYGSTEIQIDGENKKMWINEKLIDTDVDRFLSRLFAITASWEKEYNRDMLDAEEFSLYNSEGKQTQKVHCKGSYPYNYGELKELIFEVQNG